MTSVVEPQIDVPALLDHWVSDGTITTEQAVRMRADLGSVVPTTAGVREAVRGTSLVTEAMGYLGGVIVLVASGLVTGWFWADMSTLVRLGLAGGVAVLLLVAGAAVSRRHGATGDRLRSVLWLLSAAAFAAFLGLAADELFGWAGEQVALFAAGGTAVLSAVLWYLNPHVPQHAATFVPLVVAAGTGTYLLTGSGELPGAAVWGTAAVWAVLAWGGVLRTREQGMIFGAAAMVFASMTVVGVEWGATLALLTLAVLISLALAFRDLILLAVASIGALAVLPAIMSRLFPGMLSAALALLGVGVLLVGAAIVTARRRREKPADTARRDLSRGTLSVALPVAASIAIATATAILVAAA